MSVIKLIYYRVILMFLGVTMGCTNEMSDLNVIDGKGLFLERESYSKMIFLDENEGYLFGERHGEAVWKENGEAFRLDTAVVYYTKDGGMTWEGEGLGQGKILNAYRSGGNLYIIKLQTSGEKYDSIIYRLNRFANKWEIISKIDSYVRDGYFSNSGDWIITKKETNGEFKIYTSNDKGTTWKLFIDTFVFQPIIDNTFISFLDSNQNSNGKYDALIIINRKNETSHKEQLPSTFEASLLHSYNGSVFIAGMEGENLCIYKRIKHDEYCLVNKLNFGARTFPKELIVYDNQFILLAGVRKGMYIENHLMKSLDGGKNWVEEGLYKPSYASPIASYLDTENKLKIWIYSGAGKIQILD